MGSYSYDKNTGTLTTLATSGQRVWVGTEAQHKAAKQAGTLPNNTIICITDDEVDTCHYSTDETFTGMYWIDGKKIYRKVITGVTANDTTLATNVDTFINGFSAIVVTNSGAKRTYTGYYSNNFYCNIVHNRDANELRSNYVTTESALSFESYYAIIEYTKTTD